MIEGKILELGIVDLSFGFVMVLFAAGIGAFNRSALGKQIIFGAVRAAIQLMIVGYLLEYIFGVRGPWAVGFMLVVMIFIAGRSATARIDKTQWTTDEMDLIHRYMAISIGCAGLCTLLFVVGMVVRPEPAWNPRYTIPLAGMVISYAMNSTALAFERYVKEVRDRRDMVEAALALGAEPWEATEMERAAAMSAASIPLINYFATVGIVQLPGMMTGQILSGELPLTAVSYQILVSFMLAPAMMIGCAMAVRYARSLLFDERGRLKQA